MKPPVRVAVPAGEVTTTSTGPAGRAGVEAVMVVALDTLKATELPPMVRLVVPMKPLPVMVMAVLAPGAPVLGDTWAMVGAPVPRTRLTWSKVAGLMRVLL